MNAVSLTELDEYFRKTLSLESYSADISKNGIQIENGAPNEKSITKIAFAVDACETTALKAKEAGAQVLFVHHGIFWGHEQRATGAHYKRLASFIKNDVALYACHIPLDANNPHGNNFGLAKMLGLKSLVPFGNWRGMSIGVGGALSNKMPFTDFAEKVKSTLKVDAPTILPFGKTAIKKVAIISGGAGEEVEQAAQAGYDAYITGELGHENYHVALEYRINTIAAGHYATETIGVKNVMALVEKELKLQTEFIDCPTGL